MDEDVGDGVIAGRPNKEVTEIELEEIDEEDEDRFVDSDSVDAVVNQDVEMEGIVCVVVELKPVLFSGTGNEEVWKDEVEVSFPRSVMAKDGRLCKGD